MIRMIQSKSAGHAKAYFSDALVKSDYYTSDQELAGYWQGKLADRIGLSGHTSKDGFFALCENQHPHTGDHLTPRTKEERTTGYDINFHCPKSVSLLHVFSKDDHILTAFQEAVTDTMKEIETDSRTRVRQGGVYDDRQTGELIWAHFVHQTARPVEGQLPDPHLHSHCFVFNATWDESEGRIKAGQFRDIKRNMPYYQARFHMVLADKLAALGYGIRRTAKSFEIEGVPQRTIDLFSKRTDEIGRVAKEKGITDAKELDSLGARTRGRKQKGASMEELKRAWTAQIQASEAGRSEDLQKIVRSSPEKSAPSLTASQCVDHAILHCFERASVMDGKRLLAEACRHGIGRGVSADIIKKVFETDQRIIHVKEGGRTLCTTREVLAEEKRMVELARAGAGKMLPLYREAPEIKLGGQQGAAVAHVLTSTHRVAIIRGAAGTGKTTLMKEAVAKIEAAGKTVMVVAPTAQASRGVLREEGFAGAETVAKLITDKNMQEQLKGQVLWVDEAGLLGTKDMTALLEIATKQDARLILGGDTRQHASVVRGDALRIVNKIAGVRTAEVSKIYRQQKEDYRAAVEDLSKGNVGAAFENLDGMGVIHEIDPMNRSQVLVDEYMETIKKGKSALVISPTHAQGDEITAGIRARLRKEGLLGKKEISTLQFKNLNLTDAEKSDVRNLQAGQVIQFTQNAPNIKRGSIWAVTQGKNGLHLKSADGSTRPIPTKHSDRFEVFEENEIRLSKGDKIRITKNGFDANKRRLNNGDMFDVISVSKAGKVILRNPTSKETYELSKNYGHIAHAHCITSYGAQGKTVDTVFIYQPAGTFPATDAKQFYVSVSRGKENVHIYTDEKEELLRHASELGERQSAIELIKNRNLHKEAVAHKQRQEPRLEKRNEPERNINPKYKDHEFNK